MTGDCVMCKGYTEMFSNNEHDSVDLEKFQTSQFISLCNVPEYLCRGGYYRTIVEQCDGSSDFVIPGVPMNCQRGNEFVTCADEIKELMQTLQFWCVDDIPPNTIAQCLAMECTYELTYFLSEFVRSFPSLAALRDVMRCTGIVPRAIKSAELGRVDFLVTLISLEPDLKEFAELTQAAVQGGQLDCLKYLIEQGCAWPANACDLAAHYGHLEVLRFARENQQHCCCNTTCAAAAEMGHLACLQYAAENTQNCPCDIRRTTDACEKAAKYGHLHCLQYAHEKGCRLQLNVCIYALQGGYLPCLQYAHAHGEAFTSTVLLYALEWGHMDCIKFVLHVLDIDPASLDYAYSEAARDGCVELLQYVHEHVNQWPNGDACESALVWGHIECLKYAYTHGCPWTPSNLCSYAEDWSQEGGWGLDITRNEDIRECLRYADDVRRSLQKVNV